MRTPQEKFNRPELFLQELLRKYAKGQILDTTANVQPFMRATVLAVDTVGGQLSNPTASGGTAAGKKFYPAIVGPANPPNSIKARVLSKGFDRFMDDDETRVFWPMVQNDHSSIPIKPSEHVYVMFEDGHNEHGLWLYKVAGHEDPNVFVGSSSFSNGQERKAMDAFEQQEPANLNDEIAGDKVARKNLNELFD